MSSLLPATSPPTDTPPAIEPYGMDDALSELCLEQPFLERLLAIWTRKKNLILQGAPGVGMSFVAKRLAYLLLEQKDSGRIETVQFHQSYSYEDFVQGYRPDGKGAFTLRDGVFHRFGEADLAEARQFAKMSGYGNGRLWRKAAVPGLGRIGDQRISVARRCNTSATRRS
jgi:AAA domain (dynein-related subfamily)